ncbi:GH25 family lysozyme [Lactobacillus johnsonii]|uniref:GH25 family lysozyme n=2 Tax=Lactobacillus johnsonii TaxID=33959 RepID=UPI00366A0769
MRSTNKKFISALACASAMTALAIVDPMGVTKTHQVAQAATDTVPAKSTGVDVSSWQGTNLDQQAKSGAQFAVVKVSEGTNYQNPNAQGQIQSAEQNNMMTMGYHYTHFGSNSNQAVQEGNYAVNSAQQAGLPQGSYLATDWEQDVNNNTNGSVEANTNAITSFMDTVHDGGYNPMLYSSEWLLKNKVDTNKISEKYPNALWVAKYKTNGREDNPDYNYFPSMDNVAIWQYTQNWRGQNVDGNVNVVPLSNKTTTDTNNTSNNAANTNNSNANNGQSSSQAPANPITNNSNATAKPNNNNSTQPVQPTETKPAEKPSTTTNVNSDWTKQNGVFVTGGAINLRTGASTDSKVITQLPANSEVKYDAYRTIGQYTWLRQPRANNEYGYLVGRDNGQAWGTFKEGSATTAKPAETKPANKPAQPTETKPVEKPSTTTNANSDWTKQNGVFVTGGAINLRTGASTDSKVIAQLPANSEVKYDAYRTIGQYTWLRQPRANNEYGYLVGRNDGQAWGTFKEGSATATKPAETKPAQPAEKAQDNATKENQATWTKQDGTFITAGAINLRTAPTTKSTIITQLPADSEVKYDAYYQAGNYVWLRQPRANGQYGYLVGRVNGQPWGTFGKTVQDGRKSTTYNEQGQVIAVHNDANVISQRPELPTGCEATAVAMMLQYAGHNVSKTQVANEMPRSNDGNRGFVGNPYSTSGWWVFPTGISPVVDKYIGHHEIMTGASMQRIQNKLRDGHLVVAWVANVDGFVNHTLALTGYDSKRLYYNDPWTGSKGSMSYGEFYQHWNADKQRALSY